MSKKKIAVIGGGLGSMTAVHTLLQQSGAKEKYEFTIYQQGWQLGGKAASGVNPEKGYRVEEHGIHFWFGFYENAFRMIKEVYKQADRPPEAPMSTFDKAFKPRPYMIVTEDVKGEWVDWQIPLPRLPGIVGDGKFNDPVVEIFAEIFGYLAAEVKKYLKTHHGCLAFLLKPFLSKGTRYIFKNELEPLAQKHEKELENDATHDIEKHLRVTGKLLANHRNHGGDNIQEHINNLDSLKEWIWNAIGNLVEEDTLLRRLWQSLDFGIALTRGLLNDGVVYEKDGKLELDFTKINQYDYFEWIVMNGGDPKYMRNFAGIKSMYDGPFAFNRGNVNAPEVEAGTATNVLLRLGLTCKEAIVWAMQAGMGTTCFGPIYQVFKRDFPDNVKFKFFHKAVDLRLSDDKKSIAEMDIWEQINLAPGRTEYEPLIDVKGLMSWTAAPLYEQLDPKQTAELKALNTSVNSDWTKWKGGTVHTKKAGVDFDEIIIGASLASLPRFCSELINANPKWMMMLDKVGTVQTQAFQLWLTKNPKELGVKPQKFLSCYVEPVDTFADMNQVQKREVWDNVPVKPKYLMYVCGAFPDAAYIPPPDVTVFPPNQKELVLENMNHYIENYLQHILPGAFDAEGNFDYSILVAPEGSTKEEAIRYQYWRSNLDGSERYVYSLVDSARFRLKTDESGFDNLWLTGDWIQNGMNIGFVEGAVISGLLTARAVSGDENIPIYLPWDTGFEIG